MTAPLNPLDVTIFVRTRCLTGDAHETPSADLWDAWVEWSLTSGVPMGTKARLGMVLAEIGFPATRASHGKRLRAGLALKEPPVTHPPTPSPVTDPAPEATPPPRPRCEICRRPYDPDRAAMGLPCFDCTMRAVAHERLGTSPLPPWRRQGWR